MAHTIIKKKQIEVHERMLKSAVAYLRFKGYRDIKTTLKGFDDPQSIFLKASEPGYIPDLLAQKDFGTCIFELYQLQENEPLPLERWNTYNAYAERKGGRFYLIAYADHADFLADQLKQMDTEPGIIRIR